MIFSPSIPDSTGRRIPIRWRLRDVNKHAALARAIAESPRRYILSLLVNTAVLGLVTVVVIRYRGMSLSQALTSAWLIIIAAWAVVTVGVPLVILRLTRTKRLAHRQASMQECVNLGRCPACWYEISSVRAGDDGLVMCSECSARWRRGA